MPRIARRIRYALLALTALAVVNPAQAAPPTFQTTARQAILIDFDTGAVLYEKDKQYETAIQLCKTAKMQEWKGDWDKRIERCTRKIEKARKK